MRSMIFVTKNGKEEGPYSNQEVKAKLMANRIAVNDLARFEESEALMPLSRLLNLSELLDSGQSTPSKRPALLWIISISYIVYYGLGFLLLIWLRLKISPEDWKHYQYQPIGRMLSNSTLASVFLSSMLNITAAVLLLRVRKKAIYFLVAPFGIDLAQNVYYTFIYGWRAAVGNQSAIVIIAWLVQPALILYAMHLIRRNVLE